MRESEVDDALRSSGIRLFALIVPSGGGLTEGERLGPEDLRHTTEDSGGFLKTVELSPGAFPLVDRVLYDDPMKEGLRRHSSLLSLQIAELYSITVQLPENSDKPQHIEIAVVDGHGHKRKDLSVAYPNKISPCRVASVTR